MVDLASLLDEAVDRYSGRTAVKSKVTGKSWTYGNLREESFRVCGALSKQGIEKGDKVAVMGENTPEYLFVTCGVGYAGAASVLISPNVKPQDILKDYLNATNPKVILVQEKYKKKVEGYAGVVPVISFEDVLRSSPSRADATLCSDDLSAIIFSSGTTSELAADFKVIPLSHGNIVSNILATESLPKLAEYEGAEQGIYMTGLAEPGHSFEHMVQLAFLHTGGLLYFTDISRLQRGLDGKEIGAHFMIMVPKLANLIMDEIKENARKQVAEKLPKIFEGHKGKKSEKFIKWLIGGYDLDKFMENSSEVIYDWLNGPSWDLRKYNPIKWIRHIVADKYIYSEIRNRLKEKFGENLKWPIGGSASLALETQLSSYVIGFKIFQGYGLSETSPVVSINLPWAYRFGSSGKPIEGVQVGIFDAGALERGKLRKPERTALEVILSGGKKRIEKVREGVVLVKGPNVFRGYLGDRRKTGSAFIKGWFITGDLGYMKNEFLHVTGRLKDIICTSDGKKTFATPIETYYSGKGLDVILVGNDQTRVGVLVVPDKKMGEEFGKGGLQLDKLTKKVAQGLSDSRERFGISFSEKSISFVWDFDDNPELRTATLKPRRKLVEKKYAKIVEEICR